MALALSVPVNGCAQQSMPVSSSSAVLTPYHPYHAPYPRVIRQQMPAGSLTDTDRNELKNVTKEIDQLRETFITRRSTEEKNDVKN